MSTLQFSDSEMNEIFESFLVETRELLDALSNDLLLLESDSTNLDVINCIFRSIHTIKGTAGFMGFDAIQTITHIGEDLLNKLRKQELIVTQQIIDALLEVQDWVTLLVNNIETGNHEIVDYSETTQRLNALNAGEGQPGNTPAISPPETIDALESILTNPDFGKGTGDEFTEEEERLLQLAFASQNSAWNEPSTQKTEIDESVEPQQAVANPLVTEIIDSPVLTEPLSEFSAPKVADKPLVSKTVTESRVSPPKSPMADTTIRVDIARVETLMNLSGELVLGRNRLQQLTQKLHSLMEGNDLIKELIDTSTQVDFITSEIQSSVMRMRMMPISKLYQKAPRIVRDISREIHKDIDLVLKGEETELDRTIIEELNDPLIHMIRNACDHGIEDAETRLASGKKPKGTITIEAEQVGNTIIIRVSDDGKGMDAEILKRKAIEKGIITEDQSNMMSQKDAYQLIFAPGFSTAQTVSNISGRGVGMDVVRTNILKLKGIIDLDSTLGEGSTFTIKLPLTLAIIQGLLVNVSKEVYILPLNSVIEVVSVDMNAIASINQQLVVRIREQVLPLLQLDKTLSVPSESKNSLAGKYVVIVGIGQQRIGIIVDELLGQQEIVIKSLGQYLGQIPGITGSTILGDGSVVMIIDTSELIDMYSATKNIVQSTLEYC